MTPRASSRDSRAQRGGRGPLIEPSIYYAVSDASTATAISSRPPRSTWHCTSGQRDVDLLRRRYGQGDRPWSVARSRWRGVAAAYRLTLASNGAYDCHVVAYIKSVTFDCGDVFRRSFLILDRACDVGRLAHMPLPFLTTSRLTLRPVTEDDLPLMVNLNSDPAVMANILGRPASSSETGAEWSERLSQRTDAARGLGYWAGYQGEQFVGWYGASAYVEHLDMSSIGYRLHHAAWGRGLATEGARLMVAQALSAPDITRVVASTMAVNCASRRVLEKVGLVLIGTHVQEWDDPIPGWEHGEAEYELIRPRAS